MPKEERMGQVEGNAGSRDTNKLTKLGCYHRLAAFFLPPQTHQWLGAKTGQGASQKLRPRNRILDLRERVIAADNDIPCPGRDFA